jgi:hypothetical protein
MTSVRMSAAEEENRKIASELFPEVRARMAKKRLIATPVKFTK